MRQRSILAIDVETQEKHKNDSIRQDSYDRIANILSEESGEFAKAVLDGTRGGKFPLLEELQQMYDEAVDVASVAIRIMERLQDEIVNKRHHHVR
jgi:NTP pyrophosphatase (non-canonical NTP hydrolase)